MRNSQTISLEMSEKRGELSAVTEKLNAAAAAGTDAEQEDIGKADTLTREIRSGEVRYRAAVIQEEQADEEARSTGTVDTETAELMGLESRASLGGYVTAACEQRGVDGPHRELNDHLGIPANKFPLRLLAPPYEVRAETATDIALTPRRWLDRLFAQTAAETLGITFDSCPAGEAAYPYTSAGGDPQQRGKSEDIDDAAWTVGVETAHPTRHGVRAVFNVEDAARVPGLEDALQRDLRMALVESMDTAMLSGDNNADDTTEDVTGLRTHASVTETTLTQTNSTKIAHVLGFLAGLVDGKHATSLADLGVVASVGSNTLWWSTLAATGNNADRLMADALVSAGINWMTRAGIDANTANGDFGAYIGRRRNIEGAGVACVWEAGELLRDPYSKAASGQVSLTLAALWNFVLPRAAHFRRLKYVT